MNRKTPLHEKLPADAAALEERFTQKAADIAVESKTPLSPEDLVETLKNDPDFMKLFNGWEKMPTAAQANAWEMIEDRVWEAALAARPYCLRCGECCRRGSPILHEQDRPALRQGALKPENLMTMRPGEPAWSNRLGRVVTLDQERIKIKETEDHRACIFLSPAGDACLIYADRPHMCRVMDCWDPSRFDALLTLPPLTRAGMLGEDSPMGKLIARHEEKCGVADLAQALGQADGDDEQALAEALDMVLYDLHVRRFALENFDMNDEALEFYFGRPLAAVAVGFGWRLIGEQGAPPRLVQAQPTEKE